MATVCASGICELCYKSRTQPLWLVDIGCQNIMVCATCQENLKRVDELERHAAVLEMLDGHTKRLEQEARAREEQLEREAEERQEQLAREAAVRADWDKIGEQWADYRSRLVRPEPLEIEPPPESYPPNGNRESLRFIVTIFMIGLFFGAMISYCAVR